MELELDYLDSIDTNNETEKEIIFVFGLIIIWYFANEFP